MDKENDTHRKGNKSSRKRSHKRNTREDISRSRSRYHEANDKVTQNDHCKRKSHEDQKTIETNRTYTKRRCDTRTREANTPELDRQKNEGNILQVNRSANRHREEKEFYYTRHRSISRRHSSKHRDRNSTLSPGHSKEDGQDLRARCRSRSRYCASRHRSLTSSPERRHVSHSNCNDDSTKLLLAELIKSISNNRSEGNKFPMLGNVIPEFDPMIKGQTIHTWLSKVEECARLYKWGEDQIIHYALPKLSGVARTWYQTLPSMSFSWSEWKIKLIESFPSSDDYAELLTEMLSKRAKYNDSLELYYYEKINLLNRCEIKGKRAVDCLLYGIEDRSLRLGAKAAKCKEPEQVLEYFQSIKQQPRDSENRLKISFDKKSNSTVGHTSNNAMTNSKPTRMNENPKPIVCYNCNETGHYSFRCNKRILKCNICNKLGHLATNCSKLPVDNKQKLNTDTEKSVMKLDTLCEITNDKYRINLKLNGQPLQGYVDLGSQCTLIRRTEAEKLGIHWSVEQLPIMRGIGNNIVLPLGKATVEIEIQNITESIEAYIVEDNIIKYAALVGHSFTEKPGITISKTSDALIFGRASTSKLRLLLTDDDDDF